MTDNATTVQVPASDDIRVTAAPIDIEAIVWTPEDVARTCKIGRKMACDWMRRAGAERGGRNNKSYRITRRAFLRWLDRKSSKDF